VLGRSLGQAGEGRHHPIADEGQGGPNLELLDVLRQVSRCHPGVDPLMTGQRGELLDARLDVMTGDALPGLDARQVDLVDHGDVVVDHLEREVDSEVALGPHDGHPEPSLEHHLVLR